MTNEKKKYIQKFEENFKEILENEKIFSKPGFSKNLKCKKNLRNIWKT